MVYVIYTAIPIFSKTRRLHLIFKPMLPMFVKSFKVDGKKIKENTFYKLENKKLVEVNEM